MRSNRHLNKVNIIKYLAAFLIVFVSLSCGSVGGDSQTTKKLDAQPFISQLFGSASKTISIPVNVGDNIAWMALDQSVDYRYFTIERISINEREIIPIIINPVHVEKNITVRPPKIGVTTNPYPNEMLITIRYSPSASIPAQDEPHKAYLLITHSKPNLKTTRIELTGYTQGVLQSKCSNVASASKEVYRLKNNQMQLYVCHRDSVVGNLANDPDGRPNVSFESFDVSGDIVFYQPDDSTVCIVSGSDSIEPTIPLFDLPVPQVEGVPLKELGVEQEPGTFAECELSDEGILFCDANNEKPLKLHVLGGTVPVSPLELTNGTIEPSAPKCDGFDNPPDGGGTLFGDNELKLVAWGNILDADVLRDYKIIDALIIAVLDLER